MTRAWTRTSRLALALSLAVSLAACSGEPGTAQVEDAWIRSNPNGMGAAYFTITMPTDDRLVSAEIDPSIAGRVEVHEVIDDAGVMRMREVDGGIDLRAGTAFELRPGGHHLMLLEMPAMLEIGSIVTLTLRFATAEPVVIDAEVREGAAADGTPEHAPHSDHGTHHGSHHGAN
jgi:copper(I)-binding protein